MNAQSNRGAVVIDRTRVVGNIRFTTHLDRCLYLGTTDANRPRWLKKNPGRWQYIEDIRREAALPRPPVGATFPIAGPTEPNGQTSFHEVPKDGVYEDAVALVDTLAGDCPPPRQSSPLPKPANANVPNGLTNAELLPRAAAARSEAKGPKAETAPFGATGRERSRSSTRRPKKQEMRTEISKADPKLTPERMRIILDSLAEYRILYLAAAKAGIHRKTLEYWIDRSAAGDAGYDVEWRDFELRFHEQCELAIAEAEGEVVVAAWECMKGCIVYQTDKNGNRVGVGIRSSRRKTYRKMLRFILEYEMLDKWGKDRKIDVPYHCGVLILGETPNDIPHRVNKGTAASVRARKWKAAWRMIHETED